MAKRNPEIRLLMKVLAVVGFIVLLLLLGGYLFLRVRAPHLLQFTKGIEEIRVEVELDSLRSARFMQGMNSCENVWADTAGIALYITTLDGYVHLLEGASQDSLKIVRSFKAGSSVTGVCRLPDGHLASVVNFNSPEDWMETGAAVCRLPDTLDSLERLTADHPAANGLCTDQEGNIYFASSNFDFLDPMGNIYFMKHLGQGGYALPEPMFEDAGLANGLFYDPVQDRIYFSSTIDGVYSFDPGSPIDYRTEYRKIRFMEAFDDLCTDISGNIWMTDPGYSTVKVFNPGTGRLVRFAIRGIGQTSSCRIRDEQGEQMLYITELKKEQKPFSQDFNGRGVLRVSANELLGLIEIPENAGP